ncbi:MAG: PAS domain S-box protein [Acidobacteria bacterium]|nr:PAS domain S-box protein [Acidobacteriota bacterium]
MSLGPTNRPRRIGLLYLLFWILAGALLEFFLPRSGIGLSSFWLRFGLVGLFILLGALPLILLLRQYDRRLGGIRVFAESMVRGATRPLALPLNIDAVQGNLNLIARALNDASAAHEETTRQLTEERNRSDAILRRMVEGVVVIEPGQKIVFCNDAFAQAMGLVGMQRAGRLLVEVTRQAGLLELVQQVLTSRETILSEVTTSSLPPRTFAVTAAPVPVGETTGVVLVLHDITELRKLEQMRRDFVANVSHEFKTPLTAIQGFAETLLDGALTDKQSGPRFVQIIRDHSIRLNRLTNDLLHLSLIEAGAGGIDKRTVAVAELISSCIETVRMKAEKKSLNLQAQIPESIPPIHGDPNALREILINLLDNAIQYTPSGGLIEARVAASETGVTLQVVDNGIGITQADQKRIFERFYRADEARSREVGGTGLGLSITRHLVEAHGGSIQVESDLGRGSTFSVHIPFDTPSAN